MNLYLTLNLLLSSTTAAVTWGPIQTRSASIESNIATVPSRSDEGMNVQDVSDYYGNSMVNYYAEGVSTTMEKIEAASYESIQSDYSSSVKVKGGGGYKKSKGSAFWSAHETNGSITGLCLYGKGSSNKKKASSKGSDSSYYYYQGLASYSGSYEMADVAPPFKGSSKKSRSYQETCSCKEKRRELQWGNDGHSSSVKVSGGSSTNVSGGSKTKVSGGSKNKVSGSSSKVTSGSSKVTTVKVSGHSKISGGKWAGDAHGSASKISGSISKVSWSKNSSKNSGSKVKVSSSSKVSGGSAWAGDAYGSSKFSSTKTAKVTSKKGSSVKFKGSSSSEVTGSSYEEVKSKKEYSESVKGSAYYEYSCSCETAFEIDTCVSTSPTHPSPVETNSPIQRPVKAPTASPIKAPSPMPINPLVDTNPPTMTETVDVNEMSCLDDFATTTTGVSVEIPVLDNDDTVPIGASGSMNQPNHGLTMISETGILFIPNTDYCGIDTFTYTIIDANGAALCTATATITVICKGDGETPAPTMAPITMAPTDEVILHGTDDEISTPPPTNMPVDAPIIPDGVDIQRPVANDDFYTTNQDESIEIGILYNDTVIIGTTGIYSKPPNGDLSTKEDNLLYTPNVGFCGIEQFSYTLTDATGEYSDSAVVTILVTCAAPNPTPSPEFYSGDDLVGVPPEFSTDTTAPSPSSGDDLVGVPPEFNQPVLEDDYAITNQSVPVFMAILDNDFVPQDSTGTMGSPSHGEIEATADGIIYSPVPEFCGIEQFEYSVTDSTGTYSDTALVTIDVICIADSTSSPVESSTVVDTAAAPTPKPSKSPAINILDLNDDYAKTNEGEAVIIPILSNDIIPNDALGSFTEPSNGVVTPLEGDDILYTPSSDFCGTDSYTYTITDSLGHSDTATVTIEVRCESAITTSTELSSTFATISSENPLVVANDVNITTCEDEPLFINIAANDHSEDGALTVTSVEECKAGGTLVIVGDGTGGVVQYTPALGVFGLDHCDYTICNEEGDCDTACLIITVEESCEGPVAVNDAASIPNTAIEILVTENDISPTGSLLTVASVSESEKGAIVAIVGNGTSGFVFYEPPTGFTGKDMFDYTIVNEEGRTSKAVVYITVEDNFSETTSTNFAATTSTVIADTTSTVFAETTSTEVPDVILHSSDNSTEPTAYYMCPEIDPYNVTENTLLYQYELVLNDDVDINAAIQVIELEINDILVSEISCESNATRRKLVISNLVGADSNPTDTVADAECSSEYEGQCVVVNGGITVYGDVDITEVQNLVGSGMPDIIASLNASSIESRLMTSSATLDSNDATDTGGPSAGATVAIAGALVVVLVGATIIARQHKSRSIEPDESRAVLSEDFSPKSFPREIPQGNSNSDSDTLLSTSSSDSKNKKSLKSVFRNKNRGEPSSPAFSVGSSKSKSYDIEDTVDL